jgi:hypothetical protein
MQVEEFEDLLDRHGEDLAKWPVAARDAGLDLLRTSQDARDLLEGAREMREMFGPAGQTLAPPDLAGRVISAAMQAEAVPARASWLRPLLGLSLCCAVGFTLSFVPAIDGGQTVRVDLPALLAGFWQ